METIETTKTTLAERVERSIVALKNIGEPSYGDLHPSPEYYSAAERASIIHGHLISIAKLEGWEIFLQTLSPEERTDRTELLQVMLDERVQQACQIISALSVTN
jgi:hypothetical protein